MCLLSPGNRSRGAAPAGPDDVASLHSCRDLGITLKPEIHRAKFNRLSRFDEACRSAAAPHEFSNSVPEPIVFERLVLQAPLRA